MERIGDAERYRIGVLERGALCAGATDVGPVRDSNEDAFWASEDASVLVVADGLGGLPAGETASDLAVDAVSGLLESVGMALEGMSADGALDGDGSAVSTESPLELLALRAVAGAHRRVLDAVSGRPSLRGMATTLVLALIRDREAVIVHVGDSRAMLWRDGRLVFTTFDHNEVGDLLRTGAITPEQGRRHPERNLIREVLGLDEGYQPECQRWNLERGDVLMLCSDGVSDAIGEDTIARVLSSTQDATKIATTLVEAAGIEGGHDNATVIVRHVT